MSAIGEPATDPLIGQIIDGRYLIRRAIGRGGMGVVYEAEATRLGRRLCAFKVLLPEFTRSDMAAARFSREAELAGRVKHPNVVEIFDSGTTAEGRGYIAMELLLGESLDRLLRREGRLPWPRAQHIITQICRALEVAHAAKIVHRDMKPENCFLCVRDDDPDFIKVLDFGIAKLTSTEGHDAPRLTATNSIIGTYAYMANEQVRGEVIDHRVDIWAVGVMLYEMLTGRLPFRGSNQGQIWTAICNYDPEPMRNIAPDAGIPEPVEAIVRQALARARDERFPTVEALARAIAGVNADGNIRTVTGELAGPVLAAVAAPFPGTDPVSPHALTELSENEAVDVAEHARTTPRSSPARHTELVPMPSIEPIPPRRRRVVWVFLGLAMTGMLVAVWLYRWPSDTPTQSLITAPTEDKPARDTVVEAPKVNPEAPAIVEDCKPELQDVPVELFNSAVLVRPPVNVVLTEKNTYTARMLAPTSICGKTIEFVGVGYFRADRAQSLEEMKDAMLRSRFGADVSIQFSEKESTAKSLAIAYELPLDPSTKTAKKGWIHLKEKGEFVLWVALETTTTSWDSLSDVFRKAGLRAIIVPNKVPSPNEAMQGI
jgi:tRNA A-37 threonylcarbamoyl transferase component Bud32